MIFYDQYTYQQGRVLDMSDKYVHSSFGCLVACLLLHFRIIAVLAVFRRRQSWEMSSMMMVVVVQLHIRVRISILLVYIITISQYTITITQSQYIITISQYTITITHSQYTITISQYTNNVQITSQYTMSSANNIQ